MAALQEVVIKEGEVDLRKESVWNEKYMWVCDIKEKVGETSNDFLFLANIQTSGTVKVDGRAARDPATGGRCIFSHVMYDIQDFVPDDDADGKLSFVLKFGVNTKEREKDAPNGWTITFKDLTPDPNGGTFPDKYVGTCNCSWWGDRPVEVISYMSLTTEEQAKFPDLIAKYYKSRPVES